MARVDLAATVLRGHLHALHQMDVDLNDIVEEFVLTEKYLTEEIDRLKDVRGAIRMAFRELAEQREQLIRIEQARGAIDPGDILTTPAIIDQPVSPAPAKE
jgi:uncharacterized protein YydD (DUF2326 family)